MIIREIKPGYQSKIEVNRETGRKYLIVYYDAEKDNFNEAIEHELKRCGIEQGTIGILALPTFFQSIKKHPKPGFTE
jgi:hypothetical protein